MAWHNPLTFSLTLSKVSTSNNCNFGCFSSSWSYESLPSIFLHYGLWQFLYWENITLYFPWAGKSCWSKFVEINLKCFGDEFERGTKAEGKKRKIKKASYVVHELTAFRRMKTFFFVAYHRSFVQTQIQAKSRAIQRSSVSSSDNNFLAFISFISPWI